ncbi:MFS transporter [Streptomyces sp. NPDC047097]|uniref:MFS transporter n=1 Tax=Streptomyces sp. NPDC047097 TaxID=3155260 RepID=UPI0033F4D935
MHVTLAALPTTDLQETSVRHRLLPAAGPARGLALAQLVNLVGDGAYYVCSALYFARVVGLSATEIGLGLTLAWAIGAPAGVPIGHLADRRGARGVAVALASATAAAVAALLLVRTYPLFLLAVCGYAVAQCGLAAARQSLLAALVPVAERTGVLARLQSTANVGIGAGALVGAVALQIATPAAYLSVLAVDAVAFAGCAVLPGRLPAAVPAPPEPSGAAAPRLGVLRDRPYTLVTLLHTVMLLRMPLISLALPLWVAERTGAPGWTVAALMVLNTGGVMLFQVRTAARVRGLESAVRTVRWGGAGMLVSCAVFALSGVVDGPVWVVAALLVAGAVLLVWGEMRQSAGAWQIAFDLAPAGRQGQYQGFFGMGVPVARMAGPVVLTALVLGWGGPGWLVLGGLLLAAGPAMGPAVRWAEGRGADACPVRRTEGGRGTAAGPPDAAGTAAARPWQPSRYPSPISLPMCPGRLSRWPCPGPGWRTVGMPGDHAGTRTRERVAEYRRGDDRPGARFPSWRSCGHRCR